MNRDILSMTLDELINEFAECSIPKFRAKQVYEWLHRQIGRASCRERVSSPV